MVNEERILLNLRGKGLGILIGKHGQTLNALQYLTNLAAGRLYHHRYFVMLDVENYRSRREQTLTALAKRLAEKRSVPANLSNSNRWSRENGASSIWPSRPIRTSSRTAKEKAPDATW